MANKGHRTSWLWLLAIGVLLPGCALHRSAPTRSSAPSPEVIPPGYTRSYEVFGQRYYVLASGNGYQANGTASWYGPTFNGRPTASGEIYDMHQMTAAHKSLPLQTIVQVTNLDNRRSVVVRVNDRGPFVGDRLIDMSYGAAVALDMIGPGTAPVEITAVNAEMSMAPAIAAALPAGVDAYIQVGAFADTANARELARQLEQSGFNDVKIQDIVLNDRTLQRVKIGPLPETADRQLLLDRLASMGLDTARIVSQ